jgi:transposase-like protein
MHGRGFREAIAPTGLVIDKVEYAADQIRITRRSRFRVSIYPNCCRPSARVHSRYHCTLADLLSHGRPVRITLVARRFRCATSRCTTRIFVERFPPDVTATFARRTARLDSIVHHLRLALGGRPAASLARRLEVFIGAGKRREWPPEVEASIVAECYSGRKGVSHVARRHGLDPSQLYAWRRDLRKQLEAEGVILPSAHSEDRRGCGRAPRCGADHLPRPGHPAAALWLPFVRERDRAGSGASADHRGRYSHRGTDRPGAGIQVCRSPAALPAGPDIRPAGHPARPIHFGRLGRASGLVSAPLA